MSTALAREPASKSARRKHLVAVAVQDAATREQYATWLEGAGYLVERCCGTAPPNYCDDGRRGCPIWELADALVYDPWLQNIWGEPRSEDLVTRLLARYPERSLILAGPSQMTPTWVERLVRKESRVAAVFPSEERSLLLAVGGCLGVIGPVGHGEARV